MKLILKVIYRVICAILGFVTIGYAINGFFGMMGYNKQYGDDALNEWMQLFNDGIDYICF